MPGRHPIWTRLDYSKGELRTVETLSESGVRRSYRGKILGWTVDDEIGIEVIQNINGEPVRKGYRLRPENVERAYAADRREAERERRAALPPASAAQVRYLLSLLGQVTDEEWATTTRGEAGQARPEEDALWTLTQGDASELIDDLKDILEWRGHP